MTTPARHPAHPVAPQFVDRWSPRAFNGDTLPLEALMTMFEAARWSPSASNTQPWRFIYGLKGTPAFDAILAGLVPFNQGWARHAAALVVVVSAKQGVAPGKTEPSPQPWHSFDTGAAWMALALQAHLLGWHAHGMAGIDRGALQAALGVPADHQIEMVATIGRQGDKATLPEMLQEREHPNGRLPLSALVAEGKFGFGA